MVIYSPTQTHLSSTPFLSSFRKHPSESEQSQGLVRPSWIIGRADENRNVPGGLLTAVFQFGSRKESRRGKDKGSCNSVAQGTNPTGWAIQIRFCPGRDSCMSSRNRALQSGAGKGKIFPDLGKVKIEQRRLKRHYKPCLLTVTGPTKNNNGWITKQNRKKQKGPYKNSFYCKIKTALG